MRTQHQKLHPVTAQVFSKLSHWLHFEMDKDFGNSATDPQGYKLLYKDWIPTLIGAGITWENFEIEKCLHYLDFLSKTTTQTPKDRALFQKRCDMLWEFIIALTMKSRGTVQNVTDIMSVIYKHYSHPLYTHLGYKEKEKQHPNLPPPSKNFNELLETMARIYFYQLLRFYLNPANSFQHDMSEKNILSLLEKNPNLLTLVHMGPTESSPARSDALHFYTGNTNPSPEEVKSYFTESQENLKKKEEEKKKKTLEERQKSPEENYSFHDKIGLLIQKNPQLANSKFLPAIDEKEYHHWQPGMIGETLFSQVLKHDSEFCHSALTIMEKKCNTESVKGILHSQRHLLADACRAGDDITLLERLAKYDDRVILAENGRIQKVALSEEEQIQIVFEAIYNNRIQILHYLQNTLHVDVLNLGKKMLEQHIENTRSLPCEAVVFLLNQGLDVNTQFSNGVFLFEHALDPHHFLLKLPYQLHFPKPGHFAEYLDDNKIKMALALKERNVDLKLIQKNHNKNGQNNEVIENLLEALEIKSKSLSAGEALDNINELKEWIKSFNIHDKDVLEKNIERRDKINAYKKDAEIRNANAATKSKKTTMIGRFFTRKASIAKDESDNPGLTSRLKNRITRLIRSSRKGGG